MSNTNLCIVRLYHISQNHISFDVVRAVTAHATIRLIPFTDK